MKNININKKQVIFIIIGIILILTLLFTPKIAKINMLNSVEENKIANKKIVKIEYIKYEKEPFRSVIKEKKEIKGNNNSVTNIIRDLSSYKTQILGNKESTNEILYVHFKDGSKLMSYIDGNKLGVDNGNIWLKDINIEKIKSEMKQVKLIKNL
ncbi:hypothetical protein [Anaerofustis sp.]|uniref:hypothetical protein n=1 Tax=Anaerofustis sp. TaxID=1872517 RepID=UPI0025B94093|nr:hypothetical protein [Anaerofustis sp.]